MPVENTVLSLKTKADTDIIDVTGDVDTVINKSKLKDGIVTLFVNGSTAGFTTIEYESGVVSDLDSLFEKIIPKNIPYQHNLRWGDGNGYSHVRASLLGPSLTIPFKNKTLLLGTWQQIVLIDFDNRPRRREFIVQLIGE